MKIQRLLCIAVAAVSAFACALSVSAAEVTEGVFTYECDSSTNTATITAISDTATEVTIPAKVGTYKVTAIADGVGNGLESLTSVSFESAANLIAIGENCFYYCPALETVTGLDNLANLESIGASAFGLTPYGDTLTAEFVTFGKVLVKYNGTATSVAIPDGITYISDAFFGKDIVSVNLNDVTAIGNNAFYGCRSLVEIVLSDAVTTVGNMAFSGCTALESVTYGDGLTSIGFSSFANCSSLESFRYSGKAASKVSNLTKVGECAFWNDSNLYCLDTGAIEDVAVGSFWNCFGEVYGENSGVNYYRISDNVKTIAHGGYSNLGFTYVTLPDSVETIASTAFGTVTDTIYVVPKNSAADTYFSTGNYNKINYGDIDADETITSSDIRATATYIAKSIGDALDTDNGKAVIADIDGDGRITTKDLFEILKSVAE